MAFKNTMGFWVGSLQVWEVWEHTCGLHTFLLRLLNSHHKLLEVIRNFPNIPISGDLNKMVFLPNYVPSEVNPNSDHNGFYTVLSRVQWIIPISVPKIGPQVVDHNRRGYLNYMACSTRSRI